MRSAPEKASHIKYRQPLVNQREVNIRYIASANITLNVIVCRWHRLKAYRALLETLASAAGEFAAEISMQRRKVLRLILRRSIAKRVAAGMKSSMSNSRESAPVVKRTALWRAREYFMAWQSYKCLRKP